MREPVIGIMGIGSFHTVRESNRVQRPLAARFNHRRDDLRVLGDIACGKSRLSKRPPPFLWREGFG